MEERAEAARGLLREEQRIIRWVNSAGLRRGEFRAQKAQMRRHSWRERYVPNVDSGVSL